MGNYKWWEWGALLVVITLCISMIMGVCYAIWGPHYPPKPLDPKREFVNSCEFDEHVPDVHTNVWTCQ